MNWDVGAVWVCGSVGWLGATVHKTDLPEARGRGPHKSSKCNTTNRSIGSKAFLLHFSQDRPLQGLSVCARRINMCSLLNFDIIYIWFTQTCAAALCNSFFSAIVPTSLDAAAVGSLRSNGGAAACVAKATGRKTEKTRPPYPHPTSSPTTSRCESVKTADGVSFPPSHSHSRHLWRRKTPRVQHLSMMLIILPPKTPPSMATWCYWTWLSELRHWCRCANAKWCFGDVGKQESSTLAEEAPLGCNKVIT